MSEARFVMRQVTIANMQRFTHIKIIDTLFIIIIIIMPSFVKEQVSHGLGVFLLPVMTTPPCITIRLEGKVLL